MMLPNLNLAPQSVIMNPACGAFLHFIQKVGAENLKQRNVSFR